MCLPWVLPRMVRIDVLFMATSHVGSVIAAVEDVHGDAILSENERQRFAGHVDGDSRGRVQRCNNSLTRSADFAPW